MQNKNMKQTDKYMEIFVCVRVYVCKYKYVGIYK